MKQNYIIVPIFFLLPDGRSLMAIAGSDLSACYDEDSEPVFQDDHSCQQVKTEIADYLITKVSLIRIAYGYANPSEDKKTLGEMLNEIFDSFKDDAQTQPVFSELKGSNKSHRELRDIGYLSPGSDYFEITRVHGFTYQPMVVGDAQLERTKTLIKKGDIKIGKTLGNIDISDDGVLIACYLASTIIGRSLRDF